MAAILHRANVWSGETPVDPNSYYDVGAAHLDPAVSTDDFYHMAGLYWFRPYDLRSWGAEGAAMEALHGHRYFWACGSDHGSLAPFVWRNSCQFMGGFSDDPAVFPDRMFTIIPFNNRDVGVLASAPAAPFHAYEYAHCLYNPDDADDLPFYLFAEGASAGGGANKQHTTILFRSDDLLTWEMTSVSHSGLDSIGWGSFAAPRRNGPGDFTSSGLDYDGIRADSFKWSSTDGLVYTVGAPVPRYRKISDGTTYTIATLPVVPNFGISDFAAGSCGGSSDDIFIGAQRYHLFIEAIGVYIGGNPKPHYMTLVPVDVDYNILSSPEPIRLAGPFDGVYPGPGHVQSVNAYQEDGIAHIYLHRGVHTPVSTSTIGGPFQIKGTTLGTANGVTVTFSGTATLPPVRPYTCAITARWTSNDVISFDNGAGAFVGPRISSGTINYTTGAVSVTFTTPPTAISVALRYIEDGDFTSVGGGSEQGGGLNECFYDYYTYIYDAAAAADHAPVGVTASCDEGVVTLSWYNALPHQTYRVYKGNESAQNTLVGNVTGLSTTHSPTTGQQWWFRVVTLNSGVEAGERVVSCYVSSAPELANKHINRVINDGGDETAINVVKLTQAVEFLEDQDWTRDLLFWASPDFGIKEESGHLTKVYCLGTTRLPRGGDLTFRTSSTTYDATGINGVCAAFVNANNNSFGYFGGGQFNSIRRKRELTVAAMYERTQTAADITFIGSNTDVASYAHLTAFTGTEVAGLSFSHNSGAPGTVDFRLKDDEFGIGTRQNTATVESDGEAVQISIGTYDGEEMVAYCNGVAGAPNADYDPDPFFHRSTALAGARGDRVSQPLLGVGSRQSSYTEPTNPAVVTAGTYVFPANEAQFKASDIFVMARGVDADGAAALTELFDGFATGDAFVAPRVAPLWLKVRAS